MRTAHLRKAEEDVTFEINKLCIELETLIQEYRKAILWLSYGNRNHSPSVEKTRQLLTRLKDEIIVKLSKIEAKAPKITS